MRHKVCGGYHVGVGDGLHSRSPSPVRSRAGRISARSASATSILGLIVLTSCAAAKTYSLGASYAIVAAAKRSAAPDLAGSTLEGGHLALDKYRGSVVALNYWGSWCGPCRAEAPTLAQASTDLATAGVQFVGLDTRDNDEDARRFVKHYKLTYPSIVDSDGTLQARFSPLPAQGAPPVTVILDRQGRVASRVVGEARLSELETVLRAVAAEPS